MVLRVGFVREHFSSPLLQYEEADKGKTFKLVECPGGTGQLIAALNDDKVDLVVALTDPLIAGIANGTKTYRLVGSYVATPLNWAVITGKDSMYQSIADLKGTTLGISRPGSGSQTMAAVMALQNEWSDQDYKRPVAESLKFKGGSDSYLIIFGNMTPSQVNNDINGLVASVNDGSTSAFMWEWFTTKPWKDRGEVRFIGSIPTPWPSWMIAAHVSEERAPSEKVRGFTTTLTQYVRAFDSDESRAKANIEFIKGKFGYPEEDIKAWMQTVRYSEDCTLLPDNVIMDTLRVLQEAGAVSRSTVGFEVSDFIRDDFARSK